DNTLTATEPQRPGPLAEFWGSFSENRGAVAGLVLVVFIALVAIFAPLVAPHSPIEQFRDFTKLPPVWEDGGRWAFPLGT
ncbi:dipeptide ABC transporter permease DppC, partial [Acinetobacter baumannii]